jgi:hypothetical protein
MTRNERKTKRFFVSLAAGVLLVPLLSGGALAGDLFSGVHEKESRGLGHDGIIHVRAPEHPAGVGVEHRTDSGVVCDPLIETDHPAFGTDAEHKAFHGIPTDIDHTGDPAFSSRDEHRAFHGLPCGVVGIDIHDSGSEAEHRAFHEADAVARDEAERVPHAEGDRPVTEATTEAADSDGSAPDDGTPDAVELKEQPLDRTNESSSDHKSSTDGGDDRSRHTEESRGERND